MIIGTATIEIHVPDADSLKDKRSVLKSLLARARNTFNISIAEVDAQDELDRAILGAACVSTAQAHAHSQLEKLIDWIERTYPEAPLGGYVIEML